MSRDAAAGETSSVSERVGRASWDAATEAAALEAVIWRRWFKYLGKERTELLGSLSTHGGIKLLSIADQIAHGEIAQEIIASALRAWAARVETAEQERDEAIKILGTDATRQADRAEAAEEQVRAAIKLAEAIHNTLEIPLRTSAINNTLAAFDALAMVPSPRPDDVGQTPQGTEPSPPPTGTP